MALVKIDMNHPAYHTVADGVKQMRLSVRHALSACVAVALLAGCGALPFDSAQGKLAQDDMPPLGAPGTMPNSTLRSRSGFENLYTFKAYADGAVPEGPLVAAGDKLYGTTTGGGAPA
jgi:hypothetical protein